MKNFAYGCCIFIAILSACLIFLAMQLQQSNMLLVESVKKLNNRPSINVELIGQQDEVTFEIQHLLKNYIRMRCPTIDKLNDSDIEYRKKMCSFYAIKLDKALVLAPKVFKLDKATKENMNTILSRENHDILDENALTFSRDLLNALFKYDDRNE